MELKPTAISLWALAVFALTSSCSLIHRKPDLPNPSGSSSINANAVASEGRLAGRVAGMIDGAQAATDTLPASPAKDAITKMHDAAQAVTGPAPADDHAEFVKIAKLLASDNPSDRAKGDELLAKASSKNAEELKLLVSLRKQYTDAVAKERADADARLQSQKLEFDAKVERIKAYIFYGGGALLIVLGGVVIILSNYVPQLGMGVALMLVACGGCLISVGFLLQEVRKAFDTHPHLAWGLVFGAVAAALVGAAFMISNHYHHRQEAKTP